MEKEEQLQPLERYFDCIKITLEEFGPGEEFIAEVRELLGFAHMISNVSCSKCGGTGYRAYGSTATWTGGIGGQAITSGVCDSCWGSGRADKKFGDLRKLRALENIQVQNNRS